jgi:hypothetical protein
LETGEASHNTNSDVEFSYTEDMDNWTKVIPVPPVLGGLP